MALMKNASFIREIHELWNFLTVDFGISLYYTLEYPNMKLWIILKILGNM